MFTNPLLVAATLFTTFAGISRAAPTDVYTPRLLTPKEGAVWIIGTYETVTWDTSDPPAHITNSTATLVLSKGGRLDYDHPIAAGFDIMAGKRRVQVPTVTVGDDYQLVLFGDSGNAGPRFSIRY